MMKKLFSFIIALVFILGFSVMPFAAEQSEVKAVKGQKIEDKKTAEKKITGKKHKKSRKTKKSKRTTRVKKTKKTTNKKND
jgi:hypothetical protein